MENANETIGITRSFTRKLSLSNYGGNQYETCDFFCSYSDTLPKDAPEGDQHQLSDELYRKARVDVEKAIVDYTANLEEQTQILKIEQDKKRITDNLTYTKTDDLPF